MTRLTPATFILLAAIGCGDPHPEDTPQEAFWLAIEALCGQAFQGTVVEAPPGDTTFVGRELVMHVRSCQQEELRIPFHIGTDHSRTWVLTRTETGLRLKHDHRHEDGSEDPITQYGGDTEGSGTPGLQEFRADSATAALIPAAVTNVWTIEVEPGTRFVYALRREGTDRRIRVEFNLSNPVALPPAPWGSVDP